MTRRRRNPGGSAAARGAAGARTRRLPGRSYLRLPRDPRARRLRALRVILGNPKRKVSGLSQIKPNEQMGTVITTEEIEHVAALLEDGYAVLLVPLGDQVVIAMVDLERIARMIGEFPHGLRH